LLAAGAPSANAQDNFTRSSAEDLDALTAPIALYPDSLISQILMASTYPSDVAAAAEWSAAHPAKGDDAVVAAQDQAWDPSVSRCSRSPT
jgi:hypothetical protein